MSQRAIGNEFEKHGARLKPVRSGYWKVFGPQATKWHYIVERNGALSIADEVPTRSFVGVTERPHPKAPKKAHYGRFNQWIDSSSIDEHYSSDVAALVRVAVKVLKSIPGAW